MAVSKELLKVILQRTQENKIDWSPLSSGGFVARIGGSSIAIDQMAGAKFYSLRITNEKNMVIESISTLEESDPEQYVAAIYELARRQALKIDETILSLKSALDNL